jgi:pimeloyl-ACP methyl ester carboxylesterase
MISLRFALERRGRLRSLLLVSTAPFSPEEFTTGLFEKSGEIARSHGMAFLQTLVEKQARATPPDRPSERHTARLADSYWPHHRHRYRSMEPLAYQELGIAMVRQLPVSDRLGEIALPVTVVVGRDDEGFLAGSNALARGIPGAARIEIADSGHHPHRESPGAWLDAVTEHLHWAREHR